MLVFSHSLGQQRPSAVSSAIGCRAPKAAIPWCAGPLKSPPCTALGERTAGPHIRCWAEAVSHSYPLRTQVDGSILLRPLVHHQRTNSPVIFLWQGLEIVHDRLPFLDLHRGTGSSAMHRLILLDGSFWGEQIRPALRRFG